MAGGGRGVAVQEREVVVLPGAAAVAEEDAEQPLELLAEDAVDDKVDGGVHRHQQVRDLRQLRDLYGHQLRT